jgi:hypothetical protein
LFTPIFSLIVLLNYFYTRTNYAQNIFGDVQKFYNVPEHIQLANIGSSHGTESFDYSDSPYTSFNFALTSQLFFYDYAILKQYITKFEKNAVLLIPISYFQITMKKTDFQDQRDRYYHFLAGKYMDSFSIKKKLLVFFPVLTTNLNFIIKYIVNDISPASPISPAFKTMAEPELIEYCTVKHRSWTIDGEYNFEAGEEGFFHNKYLASQIVELCYANDIRPVLITTPITSILNNIYAEKSPGFFDTFHRFTLELQETYPALLYFDYSHDPRFENDFSLFGDGDHLNIIGRKKFTAIVISDLQASGLLPIILDK